MKLKYRIWDSENSSFSLQEIEDADVFTGIVDKNGKDIFENDYLADQDDQEENEWTVVWSERNNGFMKENQFGELLLLADDEEVIGNVYED
jgi:hypothetical protein